MWDDVSAPFNVIEGLVAWPRQVVFMWIKTMSLWTGIVDTPFSVLDQILWAYFNYKNK